MLLFLKLHPSTAFWTLLLTVRPTPFHEGILVHTVHIMVIRIKFTHTCLCFSSLIPQMLIFTLAISCLTTSNLPWFMDLTFQVSMQYCSLQHWLLVSPPDTSTAEHLLHFGSASSFFPELFPCSLLVAYWTPLDLGDSYSDIISFYLSYCSWGFLRQEYWSSLPFPSLVDHGLLYRLT